MHLSKIQIGFKTNLGPTSYNSILVSFPSSDFAIYFKIKNLKVSKPDFIINIRKL